MIDTIINIEKGNRDVEFRNPDKNNENIFNAKTKKTFSLTGWAMYAILFDTYNTLLEVDLRELKLDGA